MQYEGHKDAFDSPIYAKWTELGDGIHQALACRGNQHPLCTYIMRLFKRPSFFPDH